MIRLRGAGVIPGKQKASHGQTRDPEGSLAALLTSSGEGDEGALARLYGATGRRVFGLALHILSDRNDAEEATLDAYTAIWRHAGSYESSQGSPIAWILAITRSKAIDRLRARRRRASEQPLPDGTLDLEAPAPGPEALASAGERCIEVRRALSELPRDQRVAIELTYFRGLSQREVADALGAPLGTVKSRVRLGLSSLRRQLSEPDSP